MRGLGWVLLALFGGYVAFKYYSVKVEVARRVESRQVAPPGVNYYTCTPVTSRPQQVWAFGYCNPCSTLNADFAPAFGSQENQPIGIARLEI